MAASALLQVMLLVQAPPAPAEEAPVQQSPGVTQYRIGPEDMLVVSVWQNAELSRALPVRPDGKISLPLLNDVQAAGRTPEELRAEIATKLKEYMPVPEVSVIIAEVRSFKVSVIGRVQRPDRYLLRSPTTVLDILALAGGFQEYSNPEKIVVMRPRPFAVEGKIVGKTFERIPFNYKRVLAVGGETENFDLQPDDIVVVP